MPTKIDSPAQWRQILGSHSIVVADCTAIPPSLPHSPINPKPH